MYRSSDTIMPIVAFMSSAEHSISEILNKRESQGALRKLFISGKAVDFCSNDYLGFSRSSILAASIEERIKQEGITNGSAGSRLLAGNSVFAERLETFLAAKHKAPAALVFNSGYDANVGLFSSVPQRGDTILYDELVHASIHDGIRLSRADSFSFRHNDKAHLKERLEKARGNIFIAVESVYSMDGDISPLKQIAEICSDHNANLIVDEAHATGVFGYGLVQQLNLQGKVFARVHTFGKAMGCHGAVVLGGNVLKQYLINYARSFIYTTALPLHSLVSIMCSYELMESDKSAAEKLHENITYFRDKTKGHSNWMDSTSAIQGLVMPGNDKIKQIAAAIQSQDIDARAILSPTVAKGRERIRVCLHAFNTKKEMDLLLKVTEEELKK